MPEWIHNREKHLKDKNPSMPESEAWAIATQQSHATGHTPKGYGTSEGKHEAKEKFDKPKSDYVQTANPKVASIVTHVTNAAKSVGRKLTRADTIENLTQQAAQHQEHIQHLQGQVRNAKMLAGGVGVGAIGVHEMHNGQQQQQGQVKAAEAVDAYSLVMFAGFSDEMQKIAGRFGEAAKSFGHYLAGGPEHGIAALKNPETRMEALKVHGARGAVGALGVGALGAASAKHHSNHQKALQHAYEQGAQDAAFYQYAPGSET